MQSLGDIIKQRVDLTKYHALTDELLKNEEIQAFISDNEMNSYQVERSHSNFYDYLKQKEKFKNNTQTVMKGYEPILVLSAGFAEISYQETDESIKKRRNTEISKRLRRNSIILDSTIAKANFDNFKATTQEEHRALEFAQGIAKYYVANGTGNTVLSGTAGTGKSHLAMAILKECLKASDISVIFVSWSEVLRLIKSSFKDKDSKYSPEYFSEIFRNTDLLVIDDLGSEKITEWSEELLTDILDARTKTIITTNLTSEELAQKYHNRLYSRMLRGIGKKGFNFVNIKDKRVSQLPF